MTGMSLRGFLKQTHGSTGGDCGRNLAYESGAALRSSTGGWVYCKLVKKEGKVRRMNGLTRSLERPRVSTGRLVKEG